MVEEVIQVTYAEENLREHELDTLKKVKDVTDANNLTLIIWDHYSQRRAYG